MIYNYDPVGQAIGVTVIVDIPGEDGVGSPRIEERFSTLAIVFDDGDEIMTMGALVSPIIIFHNGCNATKFNASSKH
jgi:predicted aconitase with swiveling domain